MDEFIALNRKLLQGFEIDRETLAVEAVAKVGPGGNFMASKHTRQHIREGWRPTILNRFGRDGWLAAGSLDLAARARDKAQGLLAAREVPPLPPDVAEAAARLIGEFTAATPA